MEMSCLILSGKLQYKLFMSTALPVIWLQPQSSSRVPRVAGCAPLGCSFGFLVSLTKSSRTQDCALEFLIPFNKKPEECKEMNPMKACSLRLNDGHLMPVLGLGTSAPSKVPKSEVEEAVKIAIAVGYRHIDSAYLYQNEEEIGRAIREKIADGTVKREDIFYTTKVWGTFFRPELVRTSLDTSLRKLGLSYVNLYLIHFPVAFKPGEEFIPKDKDGEVIFDTVDLCATWEAMEKCKDLGLTKSIGVSNFNRRCLERILNKPGLKYKPVCNQVECHLYLNQSKLREFCKSKDIILTAYAALGTDFRKEWVNRNCPVLLKDPVLNAIAAKHGRTPAQVALRFQLQRGLVALVKSFNEKRIRENFQVFDFQLTPEDMESLEGLNRNIRYFADEFVNHPDYPFFDDN